MDSATVFLVEDSESSALNLRSELEEAGYEVIHAVGNTLKTAMELIDGNLLHRFGADVAIVDGNLKKGDTSCADGKAVAAAIRRKYPNMKIIAYSTCPSDIADYGDVYTDGSVSPVELIAKF